MNPEQFNFTDIFKKLDSLLQDDDIDFRSEEATPGIAHHNESNDDCGHCCHHDCGGLQDNDSKEVESDEDRNLLRSRNLDHLLKPDSYTALYDSSPILSIVEDWTEEQWAKSGAIPKSFTKRKIIKKNTIFITNQLRSNVTARHSHSLFSLAFRGDSAKRKGSDSVHSNSSLAHTLIYNRLSCFRVSAHHQDLLEDALFRPHAILTSEEMILQELVQPRHSFSYRSLDTIDEISELEQ